MKKIVITVILAAFGLATAAQDTITIHPPEFPDNYFKAGWWQQFNTIGAISGLGVSQTADQMAIRMITDDTLVVYGIAASVATWEMIDPDRYTNEPSLWYDEVANVKDTSYDYLYDFLRLYEADYDTLRQVGEDLKVHLKHTPISYYLNTGLLKFFPPDEHLPILPVYERYFTEPVTVADSFYMGRLCKTHRWLMDRYSPYVFSTKEVFIMSIDNRSADYVTRFAGRGDVSYLHGPDSAYNPDYYEWRYGSWYNCPLIFPILTPEDTTRHNGDTLSVGSVSLLDRLTGVMPNPANGRVKVVSSLGLRQVEVFNAAGDKVHSQTASGLSITLDTSPWPAGTYLVRITTEQGVTTRKLVIR